MPPQHIPLFLPGLSEIQTNSKTNRGTVLIQLLGFAELAPVIFPCPQSHGVGLRVLGRQFRSCQNLVRAMCLGYIVRASIVGTYWHAVSCSRIGHPLYRWDRQANNKSVCLLVGTGARTTTTTFGGHLGIVDRAQGSSVLAAVQLALTCLKFVVLGTVCFDSGTCCLHKAQALTKVRSHPSSLCP